MADPENQEHKDKITKQADRVQKKQRREEQDSSSEVTVRIWQGLR